MKTRQILFSGPMVRALLEGRKTQTRRVVKPQPTHGVGPCGYTAGGWAALDADGGCACDPVPCPAQVGGLLWVRETWNKDGGSVSHRADGDWIADYRAANPDHPHQPKWRPSIFMPRWASRLTLEVTNVRIERVQGITPADAVAEGVMADHHRGGLGDPCDEVRLTHAFWTLWDGLNAKRGFGWDANPWVWVIEFAVHRVNVDDLLEQRREAA